MPIAKRNSLFKANYFNPLALLEFFCKPPIATEITFYITRCDTEFIYSYSLAWTFFATHVLRALICSFSPIKVQGKCKYKIFQAENQETQFPYVCTKLSIDKHYFSSFQVGIPEAVLSTVRA